MGQLTLEIVPVRTDHDILPVQRSLVPLPPFRRLSIGISCVVLVAEICALRLVPQTGRSGRETALAVVELFRRGLLQALIPRVGLQVERRTQRLGVGGVARF